jgi:hypothetical protein
MKRKRKWYQNYYWEHTPYILLAIILKNIKLIVYVLTIGFMVYQVSKMCMITECSPEQKVIFENQKKAQEEAQEEKAKIKRYEAEAESRERQKREEENAKYNKTLNEKHNTEMTSKIYPKGTYLRNKETKEVGQVKEIQGERVITTTFYFDAKNCEVNENVEYLSYKEYKTAIENEINNKKLTEEEIKERQKWLEEDRARQTKETEKIWHIEDCFTLNGAMYQVREIKGTTLICYKAHTGIKSQKRFQFEVYAYDEGIERMSLHDFISKS